MSKVQHYDQTPGRGGTSQVGRYQHRKNAESGILGGFKLRYKDPTMPHFVEDRSPIQCSICGQVPRNPSYMLVDGVCRGRINCAARAKS